VAIQNTQRIMQTIGSFTYEKFSPQLPASSPLHTRVAIVGGGPVGLAVALGLAQQGIACIVIEADDSVCVGSRAICVSRRSLQILQRLGVLEAFMRKGLPWTTGRSYYKGAEVLTFEMPHSTDDKLPPMINIAQYHIEQFLLDEARRYPELIDIHGGSSVIDLYSNHQGYELTISNTLGQYSINADWLVAADGGQSFVRKALGLKLQGQAFLGKYVIVDIELDSPFPAERRAWFDCESNPGSTMLMHKQPDNIWRIDYQIADDADLDEAIKEQNVRPVVERHLQMMGEAHLPWAYLWSSAYRAGTMTLDSYTHGRVLFTGNAAHALPIFGVRGLNSGIDDADNLSWKLAMLVQGKASPALLQSYSTERIAAYHVNAYNAAKSTEFMAPGSRGYALMREAALSLALHHPHIASLVNPRQTSAISYEADASLSDSFIDGLQPGAAPQDVPVQWPDGKAGHLLDRINTRFTLLQLDTHESIEQHTHITQLKLSTHHNAALAKTWGSARSYLLRPDGHVLAVWREATAHKITQALHSLGIFNGNT
jgi:3-(3-hydroxy-phenyl)propionate hydroxylase